MQLLLKFAMHLGEIEEFLSIFRHFDSMKDKFFLYSNPLKASTEISDPKMQMELCYVQDESQSCLETEFLIH